MPRRQPPPRLLLLTDERMGKALWPALARLPRGAGVVFRHGATPMAERRALFERVRRVARARRLLLLLAGSPAQAVGWRADGAHGTEGPVRAARPLLRSYPAHDRTELVAARRAGADLVLLSPVFPTRTHPGGTWLGPVRFGLLAHGRRQGRPKRGPIKPGREYPKLFALGGLTPRRYKRLQALGADGWAAIDAFAPGTFPVRTCPVRT